MPAAHRADIKQPDFLVAIEAFGTVAVDATAKALIGICFVLDASERRRLDGFEAMFGIPIWYAYFPPEEPQLCYLFRNRHLMGSAVALDSVKQIARVPLLQLGRAVEYTCTSFHQALSDKSQRAEPMHS